ncbi:MAG: hypothetical protein ACKOWG_00985, partial [Planctomycetia bacterium]
MHSSIDGSCASAVRPMWWLVGFFVTCLVVAPRQGVAQTTDARSRDASVPVTPAGYAVPAGPRPTSYPLGIMARNTATGVEVVS